MGRRIGLRLLPGLGVKNKRHPEGEKPLFILIITVNMIT